MQDTDTSSMRTGWSQHHSNTRAHRDNRAHQAPAAAARPQVQVTRPLHDPKTLHLLHSLSSASPGGSCCCCSGPGPSGARPGGGLNGRCPVLGVAALAGSC